MHSRVVALVAFASVAWADKSAAAPAEVVPRRLRNGTSVAPQFAADGDASGKGQALADSGGHCSTLQQTLQRHVEDKCGGINKPVVCVYATVRGPDVDLCARDTTAGYIQENPFVKFTDYPCDATLDFKLSTGHFEGTGGITCSWVFTPLSVGLIVAAVVLALLCLCCCCYGCFKCVCR
uniref:Uncharacterized protein n=1 Tax=Zooxanthella nutricula TaxID=1333877 RepID=A0A6V0KBZ3_9DINO